VTTDLEAHVTRKVWRTLLLWLLVSGVGIVLVGFDLRPTPHWAWDAVFILLTVLPLCAAILRWIRLRADLDSGLETIPCHVVRMEEVFPGYSQLEVETQRGRLLLTDLREERVVADYDAVHELTFARHLGWALALQQRNDLGDGF
jgi:membrane protein YdbS with pleckstrin-like domain